jgi:hypothetical protein
MKITFLAKTAPKMSHENECCMWHKEYAVGVFSDENERGEYTKRFRDAMDYLNPYFSLRRRVDVLDGVEIPREWEFLTFEKDIHSAALNVGDSDYYKAVSLDRIHEQVKLYSTKMNSLQKELIELQDEITPHKFQRQSRLQEKYQSMYDAALKKNRLYSKVYGRANGGGTAPQDKVDAIRNPIRAEYNSELELIECRISTIRRELEDMKVENF